MSVRNVAGLGQSPELVVLSEGQFKYQTKHALQSQIRAKSPKVQQKRGESKTSLKELLQIQSNLELGLSIAK